MYGIIQIDNNGYTRNKIIDSLGRPNSYGVPMKFRTEDEAQKWIDKKSYWGMTISYKIVEL